MSELRIWTTRHTIRVAAPPKRVYQLVANVDLWPRIFDSVLTVEHIGYDGTGERVRFWGTFVGRRGSWVSSQEVNPKRMQLRFRQEHSAAPFASFGGLWLVVPKRAESVVALDHYYRLVDDDPVVGRNIEEAVGKFSTGMLESLRTAAEVGVDEDMWCPMPDPVGDAMGGVRLA